MPQPEQVQVQVPQPAQPRVFEASRNSTRARKRPHFYEPNRPSPAAAVRRVDLHVAVFKSDIHGLGVRLLVDAEDGAHVMFMEGSFKKAQCRKPCNGNGDPRQDFDSAANINNRLAQFS